MKNKVFGSLVLALLFFLSANNLCFANGSEFYLDEVSPRIVHGIIPIPPSVLNVRNMGINISPILGIQVYGFGFAAFNFSTNANAFTIYAPRITPILPTMVTPILQNPTIIGDKVNLYSLRGLNFDDIAIANPNLNPEAKSYVKLSYEELSRFGVKPFVESPLEAKLFPEQKKLEAIKPTVESIAQKAIFLYSIDSGILIEG